MKAFFYQRLAIFLSLLFVIPCSGYAWCIAGHEIVAQIAYDNLTPAAKQQVNFFIPVLGQYYAQITTADDMAAWPDLIKARGVSAYNSWHYIDMPVSYVKIQKPRRAKTFNVVWAIKQSQQVLTTANANKLDKGIFLAFFLHFVGDVHQPLHAASFYSSQFPKGDAGGNLFKINYLGKKNLHAFWDDGLGLLPQTSAPTSTQVRALARQIETLYPASTMQKQLQDLNPIDWAHESNAIAKKDVYTINYGAKPSKTYIVNGQAIVEQRLALAGYRLAALLNTIFAAA